MKKILIWLVTFFSLTSISFAYNLDNSFNLEYSNIQNVTWFTNKSDDWKYYYCSSGGTIKSLDWSLNYSVWNTCYRPVYDSWYIYFLQNSVKRLKLSDLTIETLPWTSWAYHWLTINWNNVYYKDVSAWKVRVYNLSDSTITDTNFTWDNLTYKDWFIYFTVSSWWPIKAYEIDSWNVTTVLDSWISQVFSYANNFDIPFYFYKNTNNKISFVDVNDFSNNTINTFYPDWGSFQPTSVFYDWNNKVFFYSNNTNRIYSYDIWNYVSSYFINFPWILSFDDNWLIINWLDVSFAWYFQGVITDTSNNNTFYTWNDISFSTWANADLRDSFNFWFLNWWTLYHYDIVLDSNNLIIPEPLPTAFYTFTTPSNYILSNWNYNISSTWFTLNDITLSSTWYINFSYYDNEYDSILNINESFYINPNIETDVVVDIWRYWKDNTDYTIFSSINILERENSWLPSISWLSHSFNLSNISIVDFSSNSCSVDNTNSWFLPWVSNFFWMLSCYFSKFIDNVSSAYDSIKSLFNSIWELWNTTERKRLDEAFNFDFSIIPSASAQTYEYQADEDVLKIISQGSFENIPLLNNIYNLIKYFLMLLLFLGFLFIFFKPKTNE